MYVLDIKYHTLIKFLLVFFKVIVIKIKNLFSQKMIQSDNDQQIEIDKLCDDSDAETSPQQKKYNEKIDVNVEEIIEQKDDDNGEHNDSIDEMYFNNMSTIQFENKSKEKMNNSDISTLINSIEIEEMMELLKIENQQIFHELTEKMAGVLNEEDVITDFFEKKLFSADSTEKFTQQFQAMYYEKKLRSQEKNKLVDKLNASYDKKINSHKTLDLVIKKLSYDLNLFKHLNEIKNERNKGMSISNNLNNMSFKPVDNSSEMYDWIVDVDLITHVFKNGWNVKFSKQFLENSTLNIQRHVIGDRANNKYFF